MFCGSMSTSTSDGALLSQLARYVINGLAATAIHYCVLRYELEVLRLPSAGLANFVAALVGISASFVGSRYFVFRQLQEPILRQATKFIMLYAAIACMHAALLFVWSDVWQLDYNAGFVFAIVIQIIGSYFGNRYLVFAE
jgi:putative flippase GtrA